MKFLSRLFGKNKPSYSKPDEQAVLIYLDGLTLPDEVYKTCDLSTLEDQLIEVLEANNLGECDGNEIGPGEAIIFLYGSDAEAMFAGIEATLRAYPLCKNGRVVVRSGPPGAPEREIQL